MDSFARCRRVAGGLEGLMSRTRVMVLCGLAAFLLLLLPTRSTAQAVYGSIGGTVRDSSGAVLPGATITIVSLARKTTDTVVSNESGLFLKERLLPGEYSVQAEISGFK